MLLAVVVRLLPFVVNLTTRAAHPMLLDQGMVLVRLVRILRFFNQLALQSFEHDEWVHLTVVVAQESAMREQVVQLLLPKFLHSLNLEVDVLLLLLKVDQCMMISPLQVRSTFVASQILHNLVLLALRGR